MRTTYESYSEDQFLEDAFFIEWIKNPAPESRAFWEEWIASAPSNLEEMRKAELKLRGIFSSEVLYTGRESVNSTWQKIERSVAGKGRMIVMRRNFRAAAAAVALLLGFGFWYFLVHKQSSIEPLVQQNSPVEVTPSGNKAILTLADGSTVVLDSANTGAISTQGNVTVVKVDDGELSYRSSGSPATTEIQYNTITTPRGGQYHLILSDGTKIWLNAESSLRYPAVFAGKERKVELTGEGYFEVAHNTASPFLVKAGEMNIKVLGTNFNVNAYADESEIKTTLLQGSVAVDAGTASETLKPGQQALLQKTPNAGLRTSDNVDIEQVVAWKNGYFSFQDANLKEIMRQIERWYNVEVRYEGNIRGRVFGGGIARNTQLPDVLKILEESNIHFELNGRQLTVKP